MGELLTTLNISTHAASAAEYEVQIKVSYSVRRGCQQTHTQPGEDDAAEIECIKVFNADGTWWPAGFLGHLLQDDDYLLALCLEDRRNNEITAEEERADAAREERMLANWKDR